MLTRDIPNDPGNPEQFADRFHVCIMKHERTPRQNVWSDPCYVFLNFVWVMTPINEPQINAVQIVGDGRRMTHVAQIVEGWENVLLNPGVAADCINQFGMAGQITG